MSCESSEEIIEVSTEMEYYQEESANPIRSGMNQQQIRKEVERVLKPYNTTTYRLLEYGAESMLVLENVYNKIQSLFSTDSIVDYVSYGLSSLGKLLHSVAPSQPKQNEQNIQAIQDKLDLVLKQMEAVQEDNRRKSEELVQLKNQISANNSRVSSPKVKPVPPPFPPKLDNYSRQAEQSIAPPHTIPSPVSHPQHPINQPESPKQFSLHSSSQQSESQPSQRNPALLTEIQQAAKNVKLRKVPKNSDGTPVRNVPETKQEDSVNDQIRKQLIERIRMMEDSEPEDDVRWRESDIF